VRPEGGELGGQVGAYFAGSFVGTPDREGGKVLVGPPIDSGLFVGPPGVGFVEGPTEGNGVGGQKGVPVEGTAVGASEGGTVGL
jgi:hypothetical protein